MEPVDTEAQTQDPFPDMERSRDFDNYAYAFGYSSGKALMDSLKNSGGLVVDSGSGKEGRFVAEAKASGINAIGLDFFPDRNPQNNVVAADFAALPLADKSVRRLVGVCSVGYYAEDEDQLARHYGEIARVLEDSGQAEIVLNPETTFIAIGNTPRAKEYDQKALTTKNFRVLRPSQYTSKDRAFVTDKMEEIIDKAGLAVEKKARVDDRVKGAEGKIYVVLKRKPQQE